MDILDTIVGSPTEEVDLSKVTGNLVQHPAPTASIRNKAATSSILSDKPENVVAAYQARIAQAEQGDTSVDMQMEEFFSAEGKRDTKAVMSVLGDSSLTVAQKRGAIEAMKVNPMLKDSGTSLSTRGLETGSDGETFEAEAARISTADALREMYSQRDSVQALVNAHGAQMNDLDTSVAGGFLEMVLAPFATNISAYKMANDVAKASGKPLSIWQSVKALTFGSGSAIMDVREKLALIPPEGQVEYTKMVLDIIKNNSNVIFSNDNQYNQFMRAQAVFAEGGYDSVDEFVDNASFLLDAVGVGQVLKGVKNLGKSARLARQFEEAATPPMPVKDTVVKAGKEGRYDWELAKAPAAPMSGKNDAVISSIQGKIDELKSKAVTPSNTQRIDKLEGQINRLTKTNVADQPMKLNPIVDSIRRIELNSIVRQENPSSVANILQQVNPTQARSLHEAVFKSTTDVVAEGVYGVNKAQAIINDVYPQALSESGKVGAKAVDIQRNLRMDPELSSYLKEMQRTSDVAIHYSKAEMAQARANVVRDFSSSTDIVPNDAMGGFKIDGTNIEISAVYGTKEGAFLRAESAVEQVKYALRNQGIVDSDIQILRKEGVDYIPVNFDEVAGKDGSYLARINVRREVDPTDITSFESETVRLNFFDRSPLAVWNNTGSVSRWLFDAASMLPKRLTGSAAVATDITSRFEKQMLDIATGFSDQYNSLSKERKAKVDEYIKEANFKELEFDVADLIARGFLQNEIETLRSWKGFWDSHYVLENSDVIRTLNAQGFQMFKNSQTELYAKPISKNTQIGKVYDPSTGMVLTMAPNVIDDLYAKGGTLARLRRPTEFTFGMPNGAATDVAEFMVVRNSPNEYLRRFRDSDEVLNYRNGYYQLQYKAPRFVDEITLGNKGEETGRKAIAVAGDTQEARHFADKQQLNNPDKRYDVRGNDRGMATGSDDWFDVTSARGRIAQRHRGKLLEDATGLNHLGDGGYIVNPVESAIRAAKSISGRTVNRPMLESAKARFMKQFDDVLPSDGMGGKKFPSSVGEIGAKGKHEASHTADARTTFEYINYLENGYINSIDEFVKSQWNTLATAMGEIGMTKAERAALVMSEADKGPTGFAKNFVFHAYIGTNILRNWIVQTNQILRTFAYNPKGWLTGSMSGLLGQYAGVKMGTLVNPSAEGKAFVRFMDESGLLDSVDKQNLVRGSLLEAAGSSSKAVRVLGKVVEVPRKVGFDAGESMNLLGHGAAVFDRYRRAGKDLTDTAVLREAHSEVRAISYDMNFAGDMVYNQTSPAALLQFMQVPHKAFLQATNRRIPAELRARMLVADTVLWGPPVALISTVMGGDILPEDKDTQEIFMHGAQGFLLNNMWSTLLEEDVNVDYSSLAPYDMEGWGKFFHAMLTGGLSQVINNSPSGQMFLADGGRIQSAVAQMSKFFSPWSDVQRTPEEAAAVANEVMKISSGWNNAMKARQMLALGKSLDKYGNVIDPKVNSLEAVMQMFGFPTGHARDLYATQGVVAEGSKQYEDEVKQVYKEVKQYYQNAFNSGVTNPQQMQAITGQLLMAYKDSPQALEIIQKELNKDLAGKDIQLMYMMMKSVDLPEFNITADQIKRAPISDEQKELYIKRLEDARKARADINKEK